MKTILKDFLDIEIRPMMKQLGYRKSGGLFHRQDGSFLYTIEFFTPPSAVTDDEFRISASIFSFDIADVIGYLSNSKAPKDLHLSHYSLYHKDIVDLNGDSSISISEYDRSLLAGFIRKALINLDDFFKSISEIDTLLQCVLENGSGRDPFFSDYIIKFALITKRWEYADELIRREQERRKDWSISPLLVEKYKELSQGDTGHRGFSVSWDSSLLGRRAMPQGVKILTKEWDEHMSKYARTDLLYQENQSLIFDNIPENIEGVLDYKDDYSWDFISAYYIRPGMVAAVSSKVKDILEEMNVSKEEYALIPIRIHGSGTIYYLLFIKSIGHIEIDFRNSLYQSIIGHKNRKFASYSDFSESIDSHVIAYPVLPQKYADRDLIYIQDGRETYISERLIKAFKKAGIKGIEFNATGSLRFIQTDV